MSRVGINRMVSMKTGMKLYFTPLVGDMSPKTPRNVPICGKLKLTEGLLTVVIRSFMLVLLALVSNLSSAASDSSPRCNLITRDQFASIVFRKVTTALELIEQLSTNIPRGILCIEPATLEREWGIELHGPWKVDKESGREQEQTGGSRKVGGVLSRYRIIFVRSIPQLTIRFAPGVSQPGESIASLEELQGILGVPEVHVNAYHPNPTPGTSVPPKTGPFPSSVLRWSNPFQIISRTGNASEIVEITFNMN